MADFRHADNPEPFTRLTESLSQAEKDRRPMDRLERLEARHLLQELSENAKLVRNAMEPTGVHTITVDAWKKQMKSLTKALDYFTGNL